MSRKKKWLYIILTSFILLLIAGFFSNRTLLLLYPEKVWAHRVNNKERLARFSRTFSGIEFDVVYVKEKDYFDIHHPPDSSKNIRLSDYFEICHNDNELKMWLDFKNLGKKNHLIAMKCLDSLIRKFNICKNNLIVESPKLKYLQVFHNNGFKTSYYLPSNIYKISKEKILLKTASIQQKINTYKPDYISSDYRNYALIADHFPDAKKLIWYTGYGLNNKIKSRLLLFRLLQDNKVDVLLIHQK